MTDPKVELEALRQEALDLRALERLVRRYVSERGCIASGIAPHFLAVLNSIDQTRREYPLPVQPDSRPQEGGELRPRVREFAERIEAAIVAGGPQSRSLNNAAMSLLAECESERDIMTLA